MKNSELELKRKITKVGGSYGITIPKAILDALKKGMGDDIKIKIVLEK